MSQSRLVYNLAALALVLSLGFAFFVHLAPAASSLKMLTEDEREVTWNLSADRVTSEAGGSIIEAFGKVELRSGDDYLSADFARYFVSTNWIYLRGNIEVKMGGDEISAHEAELDLSNRTGWLNNGRIFIAESNTYLSAERINKHRGNTYSFSDMKYTTCDGDSPIWSVASDTGVLEVDGYAQFWGSKFQVAEQPIMFSPYLIVPAKTTRQSGLLMPDFGHSSKLGYFYSQPFYWVIDDSRDLTITESYMSKHGFMHGASYRSRGSEDESLWLAFDYIQDRRTVSSTDSDYYHYGNLMRTNSARYWLRGMYDIRLPIEPQWRFRADVDYTSDQYYLHDFKRGLQGYDKNYDALFDAFSRDLTERDDLRRSGAMIFRDWERAGLYLSGMYYQDASLGHGNRPRSKDETVQHLPEMNLYLQQGRIFASLPLEIAGSGQSAYLYRREGTSGTRFDLSPHLTVPLSGRLGSLIASAGLHATWYRTEKRTSTGGSPASGSSSDEKSRYLPEYNVSASTELARVYSLQSEPLQNAGQSRWVALKHSVIPRLSYLYIPDKDQKGTPFFTNYDYILPQHEIVLGVDNVLTRKRERRLERTNPHTKEKESYSSYDYMDVMRLRLEQAYSIYEARRNRNRSMYEREPWRDLMAELSLYWDEDIALVSRVYWTPSENDITRNDHSVKWLVPDLGQFSGTLTQRKPVDDYLAFLDPRRRIDEKLTTASLEAEVDLWGPWSAQTYYSWDIQGDAKNEKGLTLMYNHQCFNIGGQIIRDEDDTIFRIRFSLTGLGN